MAAIQPKPAFGPMFQVVTERQGSGVRLIKESPHIPFEPGTADLCFWWRRGESAVRYLQTVAVRLQGVCL